ncbi:DNA primase [Noviherbaspirillum sp. Root189]|uniref:DNA primase n=1 Tax=Noviherbaspirillum sp. Root189 TaxID=1736487 RepID=UPI00070E90F0|nr:DNA primase [Noviherbaspirillum sp. Root189]KRB85152.1 DNA primase [Noviherbaspirillum sp. Root189]
MPRIPDATLERLKNEIPVQRLVESAGIELRKSGKDLIGACPFHDDGEPSLVVTTTKNLWHCFGCQCGGGPIDWVMKHQDVTFRRAIELLEADPSLAAQAVEPLKKGREQATPVALDADDQDLLRQTVAYYHETLKASPEAQAYLKTRGLDHPELIDRFQLGYANRTLGVQLPERTRRAGAEIRSRLENLGLYRETGHEHFNGSVIVPIFGETGNVTELYGRKIRSDLRKGTPLHLYLPGPHRGVWNADALHASKEVILCEALIDAMTFWCAGFRNVTAAYGIEGFTDDHVAMFEACGTERVLIAYDNDEAGNRAAGKLAERLQALGIGCYRIQFPHGMDANEYALKVTPASHSLDLLVRNAGWMGQGEAPVRMALPAMVTAPPAPALPAPAPTVQVHSNEVLLSFGQRQYRIRGMERNQSDDVLKVNVRVSANEAFHVDTLDLYNARARQGFIALAASELGEPEGTIKADLGRVLNQLESQKTSQAAPESTEPEAAPMDAAEREAAMSLLMAPDLLQRITDDFDACGIVGETTNKLVGYLAATSRRLDAPLAVVVQSSSAAGKSSLMDAVLAMMPDEERVKYSAMTGQSLFYMGETNLKHKILAIVEEEGASRASYALKLLQSEGELTIASTGSDPQAGHLVTKEYRVEGPVMMFLTTTAIDIDEELMNRCLILTVNEGREQTRAIHRLQREKRTLQGLVRKENKQRILTLHRNAQRLLKPLAVVNPYADRLTFLDDRTRTRRDHEKYLTLIDTIALLHQYQRTVKTVSAGSQQIAYIEVTLEDIATANRLANEVLGRSLDELPPQTRRVLDALHGMVEYEAQTSCIPRQQVRFTRSDVRRAASLSDTQCRIHVERLIAMEYILVHRGARGQSFEYELLYDGQGSNGAPFVPGLIDMDSLEKPATTTATSRGVQQGFAGSSRPHHGSSAAPSRTVQTAAMPEPSRDAAEPKNADAKTRAYRSANNAPSYLHAAVPLAAVGR